MPVLSAMTSAPMPVSAAAEGVSLYADRGVIYTVLFVGVFGMAVLAVNLKMEKKVM